MLLKQVRLKLILIHFFNYFETLSLSIHGSDKNITVLPHPSPPSRLASPVAPPSSSRRVGSSTHSMCICDCLMVEYPVHN